MRDPGTLSIYGTDGLYMYGMHATLSNPYTLNDFKTGVESEVGAPRVEYGLADNMDNAELYFEDAADTYGFGSLVCYPARPSYDHSYPLYNLAYNFRCNPDLNGVIVYDIVFTPEDGTNPVHDIHVVATNGNAEVADQSDKPFTLNPAALNDKKHGSYQIIPVALQPNDWTDDDDDSADTDSARTRDIAPSDGQTGVTGAMVPT